MWLLANALFGRSLRGDPVDEERDEVLALMAGATDPQLLAFSKELRAHLAFVGRDLGAAQALLHESAAIAPTRAPRDLGVAGCCAVLARDLEAARADLAAVRALAVHAPVFDAREREVEAGIAAMEGRTADALAAYADAISRWDALGMAGDAAQTALAMATVLDPTEPRVRSHADAARATFERLGHRPMVAWMDDVLGRPAQPRDGGQAASAPPAATAERVAGGS